MRIIILLLCILLSACSDGDRAAFRSMGTPAHIQCFSNGKIIYDNFSTGIVTSEPQSDGWYFNEKNTNDLIMVTGSCIIRHSSW